MPFNPKWEVKTKPDALSLERLIAWLETMPADKTYNFLGNRSCLLAQYFKAQGFTSIWVGGFSCKCDGTKYPLPLAFRHVALPRATGWRFWRDTFGAALSRAHAERWCPQETSAHD